MISLDCESTGLDWWHGTRPFFVTTCTGGGDVASWEWDVCATTREVKIPPGDVKEIGDLLFGSGPHGPVGYCYDAESGLYGNDADAGLILHNAKFDFHGMRTIGLWDQYDLGQVWPCVRDTALAAHLLASNRPKNLTDLAFQWLGANIAKHEDRLEAATKTARLWVATKAWKEEFGEWAIAKKDRPDMPSAANPGKGKEIWRADYWLPRAVVLAAGEERVAKRVGRDDHGWGTVLSEYATKDAEATVMLYKRLRKEIERRKLLKIYRERLKLLPIGYEMERRGVTVNGANLEKLSTEYRAGSEQAGRTMTGIAAGYNGFELEPSKGTTQRFRTFLFDVLGLEKRYSSKAKTDAPTTDKAAKAYYLETLPPRSKQLAFVRNWADKTSMDTAVSYMDGYTRFWLPLDDEGWFVLHPNLNPTGTDTTRWSSSSPNEQNISEKENFNLRYCFGPAPGREWFSLDGKNLEKRLVSYACGQPEMIELFERADEPPFYGSEHLLSFSVVFAAQWAEAVKAAGSEGAGKYVKAKYPGLYKRIKNFNFAVQYGAVYKENGWGTADKAAGVRGAHGMVRDRFAKQTEYNLKQIAFANKYGYVETMPDRTVDPDRGYPLLVTRTETGRALETVPLSYHIQGTAMNWTNKAMVRVSEFFDALNSGERFRGRKWPGGYHITLQVHDELVPDMPSGAGKREKPWQYNSPVVREVKRLMELGGDDIGIPTPVGVEYHAETWSEGETLSL